MKYKVEKCVQIVDDLVLYCHIKGATAYHIDLKPGSEQSCFTLKAEIKELSPEDFEAIRTELHQARHQEVEELYWGITYDTSDPCELSSIGAMLDEVEVTYDGEVLTIDAMRRN